MCFSLAILRDNFLMIRAMSTYIQSSINTATLINASEKRRQTRTAQTLPSEAKVG